MFKTPPINTNGAFDVCIGGKKRQFEDENTPRNEVVTLRTVPLSVASQAQCSALHENLVVPACLCTRCRDVGHRGAVAGGPGTERRSAETKNTSGVLTCDMLPGWAGHPENCETNKRHSVSSGNSQAAESSFIWIHVFTKTQESQAPLGGSPC